ncbi:uncharacterized protein [Parasteatoda tepidariorum]|nr:uncharacterized protein LOC107450545 isoform X2 [Parasteatoda tepidariorum]
MLRVFRLISLQVCLIILSNQFITTEGKKIKQFVKKGHRRQSAPIDIGEYSGDFDNNRRQGRPNPNGDVYEFHRFQHYGYKTPAPTSFSLESMLALLAPLATIPIIASAALSSMAAILPTLTTEGMITGRSRREAVDDILMGASSNFSSSFKTSPTQEDSNIRLKRDARDLDIIHKYLKQMNPKQDYNDEVMASYLQCSGMLSENNHCLERLVCQFSDQSARMASLEKDVSSLIIYTIFNNRYIKSDFKERLRKAAFFGRDKGRCSLFSCSRNHYTTI